MKTPSGDWKTVMMMKEIKPGIFLIPGENKSLFPFCNCLYLKGKKLRVLVDAGMGHGRMKACLDQGIDILILTHCHFDHRSSISLIPEIPVWCHVDEVPYFQDRTAYLKGTGFLQSGLVDLMLERHPFPDLPIAKHLSHGEEINLGGLTLRVIHTPGHTPGHLAFYIPEADVLFTADVALNLFGPFYGNASSSIDDFIKSIRKLKAVGAATVATSISGPLGDGLAKRFCRYEDSIYQRDERILKALSTPMPLAGLLHRHLIFKNYFEPKAASIWVEQVHIEKHLDRLLGMGKIKKEGDFYFLFTNHSIPA